ncbi:MAG: TRAP transporter TatT component family protein [Pseudomonadota bacterium]
MVMLLAGCAGMVTQRMGATLSSAILNQDDPETVRAGAPAYLLLIDGLIADDPQDKNMLLAGARLYGAYAAVFVDDRERALRMAKKARDYARRGLCADYPQVCKVESAPYDQFVPSLHEVQVEGLDALYVYGSAWAGRIQADSSDWAAIADLPKVEAVMRRVVAMDPEYDNGRAQLYLAVLNTLVPPSVGGRPEVGRGFFEKAIAVSQGKDLMAKVEFARRYARMVFDRELHDRLLHEVVTTETRVPGLVLSNVLAKQEARKLLATSAEYFME